MNTTRTRQLAGRVVLITGASRGLGAALALAFAREGADLVIASRVDSAADLDRVRRDLHALGAQALAVSADVSDRADVERLAAEALARFGRVDVLVNNASALGPVPLPLLLDTPADAFAAVLDTNVLGPFLLTRALAGQMLARDAGLVINVSSDAAAVGYPHWGAYGASKAALDQVTRVWAAELEGTGVGIVSVDPGSMNTLMHRQAEPDEDPGQWSDPAEIAPAFLLLASAAPRLVNGQRFAVQEEESLARLRELAATSREVSRA
jgi:NAD(P)-dependent dehydrogenase (short-subunit alcohol dehydrogenase family)